MPSSEVLQARIVEALLGLIDGSEAGDWSAYAERHLGAHLAATGDPISIRRHAARLIASEPEILLRAIARVPIEELDPLERVVTRCGVDIAGLSDADRIEVCRMVAMADDPTVLDLLPRVAGSDWEPRWSQRTLVPLHRRISVHAATVRAMDLLSVGDRRLLASASTDGVVAVSELPLAEPLMVATLHVGRIRDIAWARDASGAPWLVTCTDDAVQISDPTLGVRIRRLPGADKVRRLAVWDRPEADALVLGGDQEGRLTVWSLDGQVVERVVVDQVPVTALEVAEDGVAALGSRGGQIAVWDIEALEPIIRWTAGAAVKTLRIDARSAEDTIWTSTVDGFLRRWRLFDGELLDDVHLDSLPNDFALRSRREDGGRRVLLASGRAIEELDPARSTVTGRLELATGVQVVGSAFTADDEFVLSGDWDGELRMWRRAALDDGAVRPTEAVTSVAVAGDVVAGASAGLVHVFSLDHGDEVAVVEHGAEVRAVAGIRDGDRTPIVSGDADGRIRALYPSTGQVRETDVGAPIRSLAVGRRQWLVGLDDGRVVRIQPDSLEVLDERWPHGDRVRSCALADDGGEDVVVTVSDSIERVRGDESNRFGSLGSPGRWWSVRLGWVTNELQVVAACSDGRVHRYGPAGSLLRTYDIGEWARAAVFAGPGNSRLVVAGDDGRVTIFDTYSGARLRRIPIFGHVLAADVVGDRIVLGVTDGIVCLRVDRW